MPSSPGTRERSPGYSGGDDAESHHRAGEASSQSVHDTPPKPAVSVGARIAKQVDASRFLIGEKVLLTSCIEDSRLELGRLIELHHVTGGWNDANLGLRKQRSEAIGDL
jgi:hypothetical protein